MVFFFSNIKYSQLIFMRLKTSRLQLEVLNPHKDQLLIFYILQTKFVQV